MERKQASLLKIIVVMFCPPLMWGIGNVVTRSLLIEGVNEIFLVTIRITLISILIGSYSLLFKREKFNAILLREASLTGFVSIFIVGWSLIFALQHISSGLVTLMISSAPIFTIIWIKLFLKEEEVSTLRYIAIFTGFMGLAYLFISKETGLLDQGNIYKGGSLAFIGVQAIALSTVLNRKFAPKYNTGTWLAYQYPVTLFLSLSTYLISGVGVSSLDSSQKIRLGIMVVFNLGAFLSFTWLIQRVSALLVSTVDYMVPIVGVTGGVLILNESFNKNIIIAGLFILISMILNTREEFSD